MSLLTFTRKNPSENVSVVDAVRSINRLLERQYPDCTCSVVGTAETGYPSEWVTIELEITLDSVACLNWYRKQAEERRLKLSDWKARESSLEPDVTGRFVCR